MFETHGDAIEYLTTGVDENTNVRGNVRVQLAVAKIVAEAGQNGLCPEDIVSILRIVTNIHLKIGQAVRIKLIKCLIPNSMLPVEATHIVIFHISSKILHATGPTNVESFLLRWVLLVYDYLEHHMGLHRLYHLIFMFLNSAKLLAPTCRLLFLLTRDVDVKRFRVQHLLRLMEKSGRDPALISLLTCFKLFKPSFVPIKLQTSHKMFFKPQDLAWRSAIVEMMSRNVPDDQIQKTALLEIERYRNTNTYIPKSKRQKMCVPEVHNASQEVKESTRISDPDKAEVSSSIPYQNVESFLHFVESIDNIEYPSQIGACLQDPRLQLLMSCNPDRVALTRLCLWTQHFLVFGFRDQGLDDSKRSETLLKLLLNFSQTVQSLPVVHGFLESYLPKWNGQSHASLILKLVSCVNPCSFEDLQDSILKPLTRLFLSSDVYFKSMYVACMTKLIENFALHIYTLQSLAHADAPDCPRGDKGADTADGKTTTTNVDPPSTEISTCIDCVHRLVDYLDITVTVGLRMEDDHLLLQQTVLDFLHMISSSSQQISVLGFPTRLIQRLLLSDYCITISRLCAIINSFRRCLTLFRDRQMSTASQKDASLSMTTSFLSERCITSNLTMSSTSRFNAILIDTLAMLWHGNLMHSNRKMHYQSVFQFQLPASLEERFDGNCLNLYNNPAFCGLALKFLLETQREGKRLHVSMLRGHLDSYLQFLSRERFPQIKELVDLNLKSRKMKKLSYVQPTSEKSQVEVRD